MTKLARVFRHLAPILTLTMLALIGAGCRTRTAPPAGFVTEPLELEKGARGGFQRSWSKKGVDWKSYSKIKILSVDTAFLHKLTWWQALSAPNYDDTGVVPEFRKDGNADFVGAFAEHFRTQMTNAFSEAEGNRFKVVTEKGEGVLVLEIGITELVPYKKYLIGLGFIGDGSLHGGSMAIEGIVRDGRSQDIIAMFADRKVSRTVKPSDVRGRISWYSHAKPMIAAWSKKIVRLANSGPPQE